MPKGGIGDYYFFPPPKYIPPCGTSCLVELIVICKLSQLLEVFLGKSKEFGFLLKSNETMR